MGSRIGPGRISADQSSESAAALPAAELALLPSYTLAGLPAAGTAGRLARVTDGIRGPWIDGGSTWSPLQGQLSAAEVATGGLGTAASPWTGWETAIGQAANNTRIHFVGGVYNQSSAITMKPGWLVSGDGPKVSVINVTGATKGWLHEPGSFLDGFITIRDLEIRGTTASALALVSIKNTGSVLLLNSSILRSSTNLVDIDASYFVTILGCNFREWTTTGIHFKNTSNVWSIHGSSFENESTVGQRAVYVQSSGWGDIRATNFEGESQGVNGITLEAASNVAIEGNFFEFYTGSPILAQTTLSRNISVKRNHIQSTGAAATLVNFSGALAHVNIDVESNRFAGNLVGQTLFDPGGSTSYKATGFDRENAVGTRIAGFANSEDRIVLGNSVAMDRQNDAWVFDTASAGGVFPVASGRRLGASTLQWRVFNQVLATASLPVAASSMDGAIILEDAGAGDRNLIIYAGGQRFRLDGGAAF